ncbi:HEAT repeat domain-containing protein [Tomitella biformata]|uniref:HEAT repeat domain-containing protein n=1 Tax=Tomitella biformata TaxID=630403 RepID=UPI0004B55A23|nr:HEAT repeat domain-containing protein [Tomitella biformata]
MLIGEVARRSGVSTRMLRHYDTLGLVSATGRTVGGYREYAPDDLRRLFHVESLRTLGLSLGEAKSALDDPGFAPADLVGGLIQHTRQRIAAEQDLLTKLERVDATAPAEWADVLRILSLLRGHESESASNRQRAALSQTPLPGAVLAEAALTEDDPNVAGALRWALARSGEEVLALLGAGLQSGSVEVRRRASAAIAAIDTPAATALLRLALGDADATVRNRAALALGSRQEADSAPTLLTMIVEGTSDVEAAEALGSVASEPGAAGRVVQALQDKLGDTADLPTRLRITQALAEIPGPAAREALTALARNVDRTIAATAAAILATEDR